MSKFGDFLKKAKAFGEKVQYNSASAKQARGESVFGNKNPYATKEQTKMEAVEKDAKATEKAVDPKSGGGFNASNPSEDRTDVGSNASTAFFKKKGWM